MEFCLFRLSFIFTAFALALNLVYLFQRGEFFEKTWKWALLASLVVHLGSFALRTSVFWALFDENRHYLPINTFFGAISYLALMTNALCLALAVRYRISVLGCFVLPLSLAAQASCWAWADPSLDGLAPVLQSHWINLHPLILMGSYGAFANAFGVSAAFLVQDWQIKSRRPQQFSWQLPSLEALDKLSGKMILGSLPVLTLGIAMGGLWAWGAWGRFWGWDAKETWALITWLVYISYVFLRLLRGWQGRRAVWLNFAGFASILFTFFGVNFLSRLHGYLHG